MAKKSRFPPAGFGTVAICILPNGPTACTLCRESWSTPYHSCVEVPTAQQGGPECKLKFQVLEQDRMRESLVSDSFGSPDSPTVDFP